MTTHYRWEAFRGDNIDSSKDLLFSVKMSSMLQFKTKLHVFLANNTAEAVCDFTVKESWSHDSCAIYAGNSSTIVAKGQNCTTQYLTKERQLNEKELGGKKKNNLLESPSVQAISTVSNIVMGAMVRSYIDATNSKHPRV
ncbi:Protein LURP1 [Morella rubra]|uniref:Protein LURP1 n=1 Tax=Morella rubra TaxID=262757 RepID=A0A6A1WJ84_9ROSI|nr:Protein LURP1 [Morella rubra]